ncbi:MAG: patatin-like phospholipase family protein [Proteobacteria bacterium]|nr:patatin-like phospholipase family protein [Pseudomonadota bacterium]
MVHAVSAARARDAKNASPPRRRKATATPAVAARAYANVALVLQGGGALGAYQCGVYEGLAEAGIVPNWFAGISIGAINAALLAGNAPARRVDRLREFWERISTPALPLARRTAAWRRQWLSAFTAIEPWRSLANAAGALDALAFGQSGFFVPRPPNALWSAHDPASASIYSTAPLKRTLEELIDFDRINHRGAPRFAVGAVNVRNGNFAYFDNRATKIRAEHVMASGALPPGFPAVEIDGEFYWDGGVVSNTPLEYVIDREPHGDMLALQVDLWSARGELPRDLPGVLERQKDIQYSSRTRRGTDHLAERRHLRVVLGMLADALPGKRLPARLARELEPWLGAPSLNVVHLIYRAKTYEEQYKDYAFGAATMREHWAAGLADMRASLAHPEYFALPSPGTGVATHDVHRERK